MQKYQITDCQLEKYSQDIVLGVSVLQGDFVSVGKNIGTQSCIKSSEFVYPSHKQSGLNRTRVSSLFS